MALDAVKLTSKTRPCRAPRGGHEHPIRGPTDRHAAHNVSAASTAEAFLTRLDHRETQQPAVAVEFERTISLEHKINSVFSDRSSSLQVTTNSSTYLYGASTDKKKTCLSDDADTKFS